MLHKQNKVNSGRFGLLVLLAALGLLVIGCQTTPDATTSIAPMQMPIANQETVIDTAVEAIENDAPSNQMTAVSYGNNGNNALPPDHLPAAELAAQSDIAPTDAEIEGLLFMREEEKLARDAYLTLYDVWGNPIFQNIASSEQMHMDALLMLLNQYGIDDPVGSNPIGQFENADLQALYNQLIAQGSQSLADALAVGGAIEEIDILDLDAYIAQTENAAIQQVYASLLAGSENHLRAFVPQWEQETGQIYVPGYMDQAAYDAIMSAVGNGGGQGGQGGNGQGGNGGGGQGGNGGGWQGGRGKSNS